MLRKLRRAALAALPVVLAATTLTAGPATAGGKGTAESFGTLAVVPLDDRPFTSYTPVATAEAGGHTALAPPRELLGRYFTPGDSAAVGQWWRTAARGADGSVVAVPMLAYGGLVASRACDTDLATARERLAVLDRVKRENPRHPVYAFDVIMRLTIEPTSGYPGQYSGAVRRWAVLMDQVENLGREDLRAEYEREAAAIPDEIRADYLCARTRNHQINQEMIKRVASGTIDYLILGQDDASEFGPHRPEKEALAALARKLGVGGKVKIYPGADVLGALLVAKHVTERLNARPTVKVEWSRTPGESWIAPYQDVPYATLVDEYVRTIHGTVVDDEDADILLMANTAGGGSLEPFAARVHRAVANGRLVAVGDDAVAGKVDPELRDLLAPRIRVGELAGWSGWNIGLSIAQAAVRAAVLQPPSKARDWWRAIFGAGWGSERAARQRAEILRGAATAHTELLLHEHVHTDLYRHQVLPEVQAFAQANGDDPQHITKVFPATDALAVQRLTPLADKLFATEFAGVPLRLGHDGRHDLTAVVHRNNRWTIGLAWYRYQEVAAYPDLVLTTSPAHRSAAASLSAVPYQAVVKPEQVVTTTVTAVLRNDQATPVHATVTAEVPAGWKAPRPVRVVLAPFRVRQIPLTITVDKLAPETTAEVTVTATQRTVDGRHYTTTAPTRVTAVWRNVAAAANGATVTASGYWQQYHPDRVIDGNRVSTGSRWITEVGDRHWVQVRFPRAEVVDTVTLYQYGGYALTDYHILAEVDGEWRTVAEVSGNQDATTQHSFAPVTATGVRLEVLSTRDGRARLYELEVTDRSGPA
ncbi:DUF4127 family protein [Phytohabitans kaempferiae]|uniref:DUF4127 family protein n=1 Tax=Phytohabitans kaempferiae TaxID=1620943 RepID=A0ABV6M3U4_9ACTN